MKKSLFLGLSFFSLTLALPALAADPTTVRPWVYDPDNTGMVTSLWENGTGLPDGVDSDHALHFRKNGTTTTNASAGATIDFFGNLNQLGFDYRNDSWCGGASPRFNVYTTAGTYYFFGCRNGTHMDLTQNWTRVQFTDADARGADQFKPWPGFGRVMVTGIDILFDEGTDVGNGEAWIDNININNSILGKPGEIR